MIERFGIGIDVVSVERFSSKEYSKNTEFYKKIFTQYEIDYCIKFKEPYVHFAGKFALKEAVIKALNEKIDLLNIETFHENTVAIAVFLIEFS